MRDVLLGALLLSFGPVLVKLAGVSADAAVFYRMVFGLVGLTGYALASGQRLLPGRAAAGWASLAALCFAGDLMSWHRSILLVGPGLATLATNCQVFFLTALTFALVRRRPSMQAVVAPLLAMLGLACIVSPGWGGGEYRLGVLFGLGAAAFYAGYLLLLRRATPRAGAGDAHQVMIVVSLATGAVTAGFMLAKGESFAIPGLQALSCLVGLGLLSQAAAWRFIAKGLPSVRPNLVGLLLLMQPTLTYVWDVAFLGRPLSWLEALGAGLALLGIHQGAAAERKAATAPFLAPESRAC